jgi:hypothetical protein
VYKRNKRTGHKVFKAAAVAAAAADDDEDGNDDDDDGDDDDGKCLVISTIHEALQNELFSTLLLLHSS